MVVDVHFFNTEIECVSGSQRHGADGVVATERTAQNVSNSCTLPRAQVELHLIQAATQFHFMGNVVVNVDHLCFPVATIGHKQFDVEIVTLVEVVCRQGSLNFNVPVT